MYQAVPRACNRWRRVAVLGLGLLLVLAVLLLNDRQLVVILALLFVQVCLKRSRLDPCCLLDLEALPQTLHCCDMLLLHVQKLVPLCPAVVSHPLPTNHRAPPCVVSCCCHSGRIVSTTLYLNDRSETMLNSDA